MTLKNDWVFFFHSWLPELIKTPNETRVSLVAQTVKDLAPMRETQIRSLGQEDPLENGKTMNSSILAWRIPWAEEPGGQIGRAHV